MKSPNQPRFFQLLLRSTWPKA
ncbi:MAG TPA: hypothetical protein EYO05_03175, partial [Gammaproteobacteria bacterium]|nr:hypothetical protein [Gammaproteobacteria bacterium]